VAAPIVCIAGPTAAGKSAATLALAARWPIEIINVDSATIYRGMDVGTAKPSTTEREQVAQHLLDIRDPVQSYSAAEFCLDTFALIDDIRSRGRVPVLAGGTMLYYKALRDGLDDLPKADAELRRQLDRDAAESGWPALHARLAQLDAATAARLSPNDSQRIQRALEVCLLSGGPMSALLSKDQAARTPPSTHDWTMISLEPSDRLALHARIAVRFDAMLAHGLIDEVARLRLRSDLHPGLPSIRCVGYRQYWTHLDGETSAEEAREQALAATRQLAKRQLTWLRADTSRLSIDCLASDLVARVIDACAPILDRADRA